MSAIPSFEDQISVEQIAGELATLEEMREVLARYADLDTQLFDDKQIIKLYFKFLQESK